MIKMPVKVRMLLSTKMLLTKKRPFGLCCFGFTSVFTCCFDSDDRSRACLVSGGSVIRHHPRQRGSTHLVTLDYLATFAAESALSLLQMFLFQYNFGEDIPLALVSALAGRESKRFHSRLKQVTVHAAQLLHAHCHAAAMQPSSSQRSRCDRQRC